MTIAGKVELRSLCEAENLETYNRLENLENFNVYETIFKTTNSFPVLGPPESTINNVLQITSNLGATVDVKDISIAIASVQRRERNPSSYSSPEEWQKFTL